MKIVFPSSAKLLDLWRNVWQVTGAPFLPLILDDSYLEFFGKTMEVKYWLRRDGNTVCTDCPDVGVVLQSLTEMGVATETECKLATLERE